MSPSVAMAAGTRADPVHQVAEEQPVPDADDEARLQQEPPVVDRDHRPADRDERARIIRAGGACEEQGSTIRRYIAWRNRHVDDGRVCEIANRANVG
jgi:hypothetical protein